jgi:hypothetical protein
VLDLSIVCAHQDILRLDDAVHQSPLVRGVEGRRDLTEEPGGALALF